MAVATGLFAFLPGLKLPAEVLFAVGFVITITGFVEVRSRGVIIHDRWSTPRIMRAIRRAESRATIRILQTWFPEEEFVSDLQHLYRHDGKRFRLEVMLLNPGRQDVVDVLSARVKLRWIDRDKAAQDISVALQGLLRLKREMDSKWAHAGDRHDRLETVDMEVRLYDFLPFGPIYQVDDQVMFVGFYLNHASSVFGPMLEVRKSRAPQVWRVFEDNLHNGWDAAAPYYPPIVAPGAAHG